MRSCSRPFRKISWLRFKDKNNLFKVSY
jgi:hypothetical protein